MRRSWKLLGTRYMLALQSESTEVEMEFSNQQKLIITLLTDIHAHLGINNSVDPVFVQRMVLGGHGWALEWAYPGLFEDSIETPEIVTFVADVLTMWEAIEEIYGRFDQSRKDQLAELAPAFGRDPLFRGFDGNHEADLRGIVHILVNDLDRWSIFKGRDTNSHMRSVDGYRRMLEVYERILDAGYEFNPSVEELAEVLNARIHPGNRHDA